LEALTATPATRGSFGSVLRFFFHAQAQLGALPFLVLSDEVLAMKKKNDQSRKGTEISFYLSHSKIRNNVSSVEATSLSDPSPCTFSPPKIRDQSGFPTFLSFSNHSFPAQN
jgi:hypothetical protein